MKVQAPEHPPELAGLSLRVLHRECRGQGCAQCEYGFVWRSTYPIGGGEQGDDFSDLDDEGDVHT